MDPEWQPNLVCKMIKDKTIVQSLATKRKFDYNTLHLAHTFNVEKLPEVIQKVRIKQNGPRELNRNYDVGFKEETRGDNPEREF